MNPTTETAQGHLISLNHKMLSLKDWLNRHPIPVLDWTINGSAFYQSTFDLSPTLTLRIKFPTYREAMEWGHRHCSFVDQSAGYDRHHLMESFISIDMLDFSIHLAFPEHNHPRYTNPHYSEPQLA